MSCENNVNEKLLKNFNLLANIVRQSTESNDFKVDLSRLEAMINHKLPDSLKKYAPEDFYELYVDFKSEYEKFRDFILYDKLIGKNIIALGGGFSSGKSSFLNRIMGRPVLPVDIDPSTSVPTYIVAGQAHEVEGINVFDKKVAMQPRDIRSISHGFGQLNEEDAEEELGTPVNTVTLGHILNTIFFSTPLHKYANIAFLDTPGYSKPDSEKYSAKTDEQIARGQLNSSNYILWFVQADAGTITEEDIKFIKSLREDIPLLIILNKADKKTCRDLKDIIAKIKTNLELKGIRYLDVLAFSDRLDEIGDGELADFIRQNTDRIMAQIATWNQQIYESNFARNFKVLFMRCRDFYESEIEEESRRLSRLNLTLTKLSGEDVPAEILEPVYLVVKEIQKNINKLKEIQKLVKDLQNEFFTEIKFIADVVGIDMPEPSEIDLIQSKVQNPLQIFEEYQKQQGQKTDPNLVQMIRDLFEDITPTIDFKEGGSRYRNELIDVIEQNFKIAPDQIRINDIFLSVNDLAESIPAQLDNVDLGTEKLNRRFSIKTQRQRWAEKSNNEK